MTKDEAKQIVELAIEYLDIAADKEAWQHMPALAVHLLIDQLQDLLKDLNDEVVG